MSQSAPTVRRGGGNVRPLQRSCPARDLLGTFRSKRARVSFHRNRTSSPGSAARGRRTGPPPVAGRDRCRRHSPGNSSGNTFTESGYPCSRAAPLQFDETRLSQCRAGCRRVWPPAYRLRPSTARHCQGPTSFAARVLQKHGIDRERVLAARKGTDPA